MSWKDRSHWLGRAKDGSKKKRWGEGIYNVVAVRASFIAPERPAFMVRQTKLSRLEMGVLSHRTFCNALWRLVRMYETGTYTHTHRRTLSGNSLFRYWKSDTVILEKNQKSPSLLGNRFPKPKKIENIFFFYQPVVPDKDNNHVPKDTERKRGCQAVGAGILYFLSFCVGSLFN